MALVDRAARLRKRKRHGGTGLLELQRGNAISDNALYRFAGPLRHERGTTTELVGSKQASAGVLVEFHLARSREAFPLVRKPLRKLWPANAPEFGDTRAHRPCQRYGTGAGGRGAA
jgi:hypothetical protein